MRNFRNWSESSLWMASATLVIVLELDMKSRQIDGMKLVCDQGGVVHFL